MLCVCVCFVLVERHAFGRIQQAASLRSSAVSAALAMLLSKPRMLYLRFAYASYGWTQRGDTIRAPMQQRCWAAATIVYVICMFECYVCVHFESRASALLCVCVTSPNSQTATGYTLHSVIIAEQNTRTFSTPCAGQCLLFISFWQKPIDRCVINSIVIYTHIKHILKQNESLDKIDVILTGLAWIRN